MTNDLKQIMDAAKTFAGQHAVELAHELIEWQETALLRDGRLRELARIVEPMGSAKDLSIAEHTACRAIMEALAAPAPQPEHRVVAALRKLTMMARTTGGTAGPDAELMAACDEASDALAGIRSPSAGGAARPEIDRLNSERLDLACLVLRLIRRMRAARSGKGMAAGDDALEQQARGYLQRKGLSPNPLRDSGDEEIVSPSVGDTATAEVERWRALAMDYAVACGELSKGLDASSPMWSDLKALGARLDADPEGKQP